MSLQIRLKYLLVLLLFLAQPVVYASVAEHTGDKNLVEEDSIRKLVNITAVPKPEGLKLRWTVNYDVYECAKAHQYTIAIRYIREDVFRKDTTKWKEIKGIPLESTDYKLEGLDENEDYMYSIGLDTGKEVVWSKNHPARTELSWGIFKFIVLIGSLGLFIYGMKVMSEGLQQVLGARLRNQLGSIASNQLRGVLAGFSISSIIQSSTVTVVMAASFVNAGILTLIQSAGVIMGANIGTTMKAWFINLLAFEIDLSNYALFILAFVAPLLFFGKKRWKPWVNSIFGFVFLFMGLGFMVESMPEDISDFAFIQTLLSYGEIPVLGVLLFVAIGVLITALVQSSSATMVLTMVMVNGGILPFDSAVAIILGANLGTVVAVELATSTGNVHAKRSARIHSLFNGIGFVWALLLLPFIIQGIQWFMLNVGWGDPINEPVEHANSGLVLFHTLFNLINTLLLIGFIPQLVKWSEKTVKSKGKLDEVFHLEFIGTGILSTADLSILEAKKEIAKFGALTERMSKMTRSLLYEKNTNQIEKILTRIEKYEDITDKIEIEVVKYLNKIAEGDLTEHTAMRIRGMNSMANDLERIGDIFYQMSKTIERKTTEKLWFTPEQRNNIATMFDAVDEALIIMCENLNAHHEKVSLDGAIAAERKIDETRNKLRKDYLESLSNQDPNFKAGMIYNDLFSSLEKVGDHIINVSEAIVGKV